MPLYHRTLSLYLRSLLLYLLQLSFLFRTSPASRCTHTRPQNSHPFLHCTHPHKHYLEFSSPHGLRLVPIAIGMWKISANLLYQICNPKAMARLLALANSIMFGL